MRYSIKNNKSSIVSLEMTHKPPPLNNAFVLKVEDQNNARAAVARKQNVDDLLCFIRAQAAAYKSKPQRAQPCNHMS